MTREVDPLDPAVLERINRVLEDEVAAAMTTVPAPAIERTEATVEAVAEYARRLEEELPEPLEKIKLTAWQVDALGAMHPQRPAGRYGVGGQLGHLAGTPVELVDDEADSSAPTLVPMDVDELRGKLAGLGLVDVGSAGEDDHKTVICSPVDEPRVSRAANGFLADVVASEFVKPGQLLISISPAFSQVATKACGGVIEGRVLVAEPDPLEVVLPADREPPTVEYVGFDEPPGVIVELQSDPMRGWLRQLLGRWFG